MKIEVKDLQPNPFRRIDRYPIDKEKMENLKISIEETSFWDNILVRPNGKKFQIAYGHHRHIALQELGIKEVDLPVRDLDDGMMIRIMANENMDSWGTAPIVINETVLVAKEFLDAELAKFDTWEDSATDKVINGIFPDPIPLDRWNQLRVMGAGRDTILKFLGKMWKQWMVQGALDILKSDDIDRKATEEFPFMSQAVVFKQEARRHKMTTQEQRAIAKKLVKEGVSRENIKDEVDTAVAKRRGIEKSLKPKPKPKSKQPPLFPEFMDKLGGDMASVAVRLRKAQPHLHSLGDGYIKNQFTREGKILLKLLTDVFSSKEGSP